MLRLTPRVRQASALVAPRVAHICDRHDHNFVVTPSRPCICCDRVHFPRLCCLKRESSKWPRSADAFQLRPHPGIYVAMRSGTLSDVSTYSSSEYKMAWSIWLTFLLAATVRSEFIVSICQAYSVANTVTVTTYLTTITEYGSAYTANGSAYVATIPSSVLQSPRISAINTLSPGLVSAIADTNGIGTGNVPSNPVLSSPVSAPSAFPYTSGTQGFAVGDTASGSLVQTATTPASAPVVSTDPQVMQSTFMMTFTTPSNPIGKRQIYGMSYMGFSNNLSWLYPNPLLAAMFYMGMTGALQSGNMFVAMAASNGGMGFMLQVLPPLIPIVIVIDPFGSVIMPGASGFCSGAGGFLNFVPTSGSAPAGCAPVVPGLVAASPPIVTSTVPVIPAQIAPATTTKPPNFVAPSSIVPYIPVPNNPVPYNSPVPDIPVVKNIAPSSIAANIIPMITPTVTNTPLELVTVTRGATGSVLSGYYRFCSTLTMDLVYCSDIPLPASADAEPRVLLVLPTPQAPSTLLLTTLIPHPAPQSTQPAASAPSCPNYPMPLPSCNTMFYSNPPGVQGDSWQMYFSGYGVTGTPIDESADATIRSIPGTVALCDAFTQCLAMFDSRWSVFALYKMTSGNYLCVWGMDVSLGYTSAHSLYYHQGEVDALPFILANAQVEEAYGWRGCSDCAPRRCNSILSDGTTFQTTSTSLISGAPSTSSAFTETTPDVVIPDLQLSTTTSSSTSTSSAPDILIPDTQSSTTTSSSASTSSALTETIPDVLIPDTQSTTTTSSSAIYPTNVFIPTIFNNGPQPASCPNSRLVTSTDGSTQYFVCPDTDRMGSDIYWYVPQNIQDCIDSCTSSIECLGVEYRLPTRSVQPYCWHKGPAYRSFEGPGYASGLRANNRPSSTLCEDQSTLQAANGVEFIVCPGVTRLGMRTVMGALTVPPQTIIVPTQADCMDQCASTVDCSAWTYEEGSTECTLQYLPPLTRLVGYEMALLKTWGDGFAVGDFV